MSIFQLGTDVGEVSRPGAVGDWAGNGVVRWASGFNEAGAAKQITSTTITDPGDDTDITLTVDAGLGEVDITVNTDTGLDATGIALLFKAAINQEPRIRANVEADNAAGVLTLTSLREGVSFSLTESDAALSTPSTSQSADSADPIPVGRFVVDQGQVGSGPERKVAVASEARFSAQVQTITSTYVASNVLSLEVYRVVGSREELIGQAAVTAATDLNATLDALATAINADLPADSVLVASNPATATELVLTAEVLGLEFVGRLTHVGGGASAPTIEHTDTTGPNASTSLVRALAGLSLRPLDEEVADQDDDDPEWPAGVGIRYGLEGELFVESTQTPTHKGRVWVELAVGAASGRAYTDAGADRVPLPLEMAHWVRDSTHSMAVLRLNIP